MNRFNRVTAILLQLQSKKIVRAKDIADRFKVSIRTVYRDIKTLEEAGVPIGSDSGVGYYLIDGYRLPPVMFTKEEVTAFLTAEKLIEKFTDNSIDTNFKSGMMKIRAILSNSEKVLLENIEENIEVIRNKSLLDNSGNSNRFQSLVESISEKRTLNIRYHTFYSNEIKERNIEPIGVFFSGNHWHTIAFCELRQCYRDFRLDRIMDINKTDKIFRKKHPSIKDYLNKISKEQNLETIIIRVDKNIVQYLKEQKYYNGFVGEQEIGDAVQMTFLTSSTEYFIRWYLMFADKAEIISPKSLKVSLQGILHRASSRNFSNS